MLKNAKADVDPIKIHQLCTTTWWQESNNWICVNAECKEGKNGLQEDEEEYSWPRKTWVGPETEFFCTSHNSNNTKYPNSHRWSYKENSEQLGEREQGDHGNETKMALLETSL